MYIDFAEDVNDKEFDKENRMSVHAVQPGYTRMRLKQRKTTITVPYKIAYGVKEIRKRKESKDKN